MKDNGIDVRKEEVKEKNYETSRLKAEEDFLLRVGTLSQDLNNAIGSINKSKAVNK